ncbi:hypothetical protein PINS_up022851 [Pythium insidiosum]|nr:hypothetical protein PINS_up022851 [Pythium insidiosum]
MMPATTSFLPHMSISSVEMQFGSPAGDDSEASVSPVSLLAFLQTTNLSFSRHLPTVSYVADRLANMGFENPMSLAFVQPHELAAASIDNAMDQRELFQQARDSFSAQLLEAAGPPDLHTLITVSKWFTLCGIPRAMAVSYSALLQQLGYDSVQQFHDLRFDAQARGVFRPGHHHLFMFHLERVLSRSTSRSQSAPYYAGSHDRDFDSTLLDELIPSDGSAPFGMSPAVARGSAASYGSDAAFYESAAPADAQRPGSFTEMMQPAPPSSYRTLTEHELSLLHDAVNLPAKTNPCRRGRRVEWNVLASNGDERRAVRSARAVLGRGARVQFQSTLRVAGRAAAAPSGRRSSCACCGRSRKTRVVRTARRPCGSRSRRAARASIATSRSPSSATRSYGPATERVWRQAPAEPQEPPARGRKRQEGGSAGRRCRRRRPAAGRETPGQVLQGRQGQEQVQGRCLREEEDSICACVWSSVGVSVVM